MSKFSYYITKWLSVIHFFQKLQKSLKWNEFSNPRKTSGFYQWSASVYNYYFVETLNESEISIFFFNCWKNEKSAKTFYNFNCCDMTRIHFHSTLLDFAPNHKNNQMLKVRIPDYKLFFFSSWLLFNRSIIINNFLTSPSNDV